MQEKEEMFPSRQDDNRTSDLPRSGVQHMQKAQEKMSLLRGVQYMQKAQEEMPLLQYCTFGFRRTHRTAVKTHDDF